MNTTAYAAEELAAGLDWIGEIAPGGPLAFRALLASTVGRGGETPSPKGLALVRLALAAAGCCSECVQRQVRAVAQAGATRDEVISTLQRGVLMADGPAMALGAEALAAFDALLGYAPQAAAENLFTDDKSPRTARRTPQRMDEALADEPGSYAFLSAAVSAAHS